MQLFDDLVPSITAPQRAFLDSIASGESSGDYNVVYGGGKFNSYADHPRQYVPITAGPNAGKKSSAAGKYQFLGSTWDEAKNALGLPDFSPASQDRAAAWLAERDYKKRTGRTLWSDVEAAAGDPEKLNAIGSSLSGTWTSLPKGIEPNKATSGFGQRVSMELSSQNKAGLFDDLIPKAAPAQSGKMRVVVTPETESAPPVEQESAGVPQTDSAQRLSLDIQNEMAAASQGTTPSVAAHQPNLISDEAFEGDDGNVYFKDPITGEVVPTDQNQHVAIRDPNDNMVKIFARTETTDEGRLSGLGRVARIGTISGAPSRLPGGMQAAVPAAAPREGQLVAQAGERLGVELPRAVTSDMMGVQQAGKVATNVPIGGTPLRQASQRAIGQLDEAVEATQGAYGSGDVASAGMAARHGITGALKAGDEAVDNAALALQGGAQTRDIWRSLPMSARVEALYNRVDDLVNPVVTAEINNARKAALEIMGRRTNAALPPSKNVDELLEAVNRPTGMNYEGVKDLRSAFGEMLKGQRAIPEGMGVAEVKQIYGALSKDMRVIIARAGGTEGLKAYEKAERVFKRWADIRETLSNILKAPSDEAIFSKIIATASTSSRADIKTLGRIRAAVGKENWDEIASGVISKLGRDVEGNFTPDRFLSAYGKLTKEGKDMLFRSKHHTSHAAALDDIATISSRFKSLNQFANPSGTGQTVLGGAMGYGVLAHPLETATAILGARMVSNVLAKPASARALASWSRAYERTLKVPTKATIEGFRQSSKLLATNVGRELGATDLVPKLTRQFQGALPSGAEDE